MAIAETISFASFIFFAVFNTLLNLAGFTALLRRQIFHLVSLNEGLLRGCALNGHDVLRGFNFWGTRWGIECVVCDYYRNSSDINQKS